MARDRQAYYEARIATYRPSSGVDVPIVKIGSSRTFITKNPAAKKMRACREETRNRSRLEQLGNGIPNADEGQNEGHTDGQ